MVTPRPPSHLPPSLAPFISSTRARARASARSAMHRRPLAFVLACFAAAERPRAATAAPPSGSRGAIRSRAVARRAAVVGTDPLRSCVVWACLPQAHSRTRTWRFCASSRRFSSSSARSSRRPRRSAGDEERSARRREGTARCAAPSRGRLPSPLPCRHPTRVQTRSARWERRSAIANANDGRHPTMATETARDERPIDEARQLRPVGCVHNPQWNGGGRLVGGWLVVVPGLCLMRAAECTGRVGLPLPRADARV